MTIYVICNEKSYEYKEDLIYRYIYTDNMCETVYKLLDSSYGDTGGEVADDGILGIYTAGRFLVRNDQPLIASYIERIIYRYDLILPYEGVDAKSGARETIPGAIIGKKGVLQDLREEIVESIRLATEDKPIAEVTESIKNSIMAHGYRVKSESLAKANPEKWNAGYQRIEVLQKYTDTLLAEYISLRENRGFDNSFMEDDPFEGSFDEKIPVWMCWWQGIDNAPELVRACIASIRRNLPPYTVPIIITLDNWSEYVTFSDAVIDKFNRGIISFTHLADMLRCELLYRYGGMWIDSTYFVSSAIPEEYFYDDFFTLAFEKPLWGMDIMRGRWSSSLLGANKRHSPVFQFMTEALWLYWERMNETIDYFFWDYILDSGYRHITDIRAEVDSARTNSNQVYDLQLELNQRISDRDIERLKTDSVFYKINRRNEYVKKTKHGFKTFYWYITEGIDAADDDCSVSQNGSLNSNFGVKLSCESESDLVTAIREINPYLIIDMNGYYADKRWISRGVIDDLILHDLTIEKDSHNVDDAIENRCIYDSVIGTNSNEAIQNGLHTDMVEARIIIERKYELLLI